MDFDRYQTLARRTQNPKLLPDERRMHALHGLSAEVGEIHSIFQKVYQGHPFKRAAVLDELGDVLWFAAELCDVLDVHMSDVASGNIAKLERRYKNGFTEEESLHRREYDE